MLMNFQQWRETMSVGVGSDLDTGLRRNQYLQAGNVMAGGSFKPKGQQQEDPMYCTLHREDPKCKKKPVDKSQAAKLFGMNMKKR